MDAKSNGVKAQSGFQIEVCNVPTRGNYLKVEDVLRWLRGHAQSEPASAEIFNRLVDELLSLHDISTP